MDRSLVIGVGVVGAGLLGLALWRRHVYAGLPGSVEPDKGGMDEAPPDSPEAHASEKDRAK